MTANGQTTGNAISAVQNVMKIMENVQILIAIQWISERIR